MKNNVKNLKEDELHRSEYLYSRPKRRSIHCHSFLSPSILFTFMVSVACLMTRVNGSCNPLPCDPLPDGIIGQVKGCHPTTRVGNTLCVVVDDYLSNDAAKKAAVVLKYGEISDWDVSQVKHMGWLFVHQNTFTADLGKWVTTEVTDMTAMFQGCSSFNGDVSKFDISNVKYISHMFYGARSFNVDVSKFDVSKVTRMQKMFEGATSYNQVLCGITWIQSTAAKTNMFTNAGANARISTDGICCNLGTHLRTTGTGKICSDCNYGKYQDEYGFTGTSCTKECSDGTSSPDSNRYYCSRFDPLPNGNGCFTGCLPAWTWCCSDRTGSLGAVVDEYLLGGEAAATVVAKYGTPSNWDVSRVTNMKNLFRTTNFNEDLSRWNVQQVTNMQAMFSTTIEFNSDLSNWPVENVQDMYAMFHYATKFNSDLSSWNVAKITNTAQMFQGATSFNSDLSKWNVKKVVLMDYMFNSAALFTSNLVSWNVANVKSMDYMFKSAISFNIDLSNWSVGEVTTMKEMFKFATAFNQMLCGVEWIQSTATQTEMFDNAGADARIGSSTEICSCSLGKFLTTTTSKTCSDCNYGKYQDEYGFKSSSCTKECSVGKYSDEQASKTENGCKSCATGTFNDQTGRASCRICLTGTYSNEVALPNCKADCNAGSFISADKRQCSVCPYGRWQDQDAQSSCTKCVAGKISKNVAQISDAACKDCNIGLYNPYVGHPESCLPCESATVKGASNCTGCDPGKYIDNTGDASDGDVECNVCPLGQFSNVRDAEACENCPKGYYTNDKFNSNNFLLRNRCQGCKRGTYGTVRKQERQDQCENCTAGRYSDSEGLAIETVVVCKACIPGRYSDEEGNSKDSQCRNCKSGTWSSAKAASTPDACVKCGIGRYSDNVAVAAEDSCKPCDLGFEQIEEGKAFCLPCTPGHFGKENDAGVHVCSPCLKGTYQKLTGQTTCESCLSGFFNDADEGTTCLAISPGFYFWNGKERKCVPGHYCPGLDTNETACKAGRYATSPGSISCIDCSPGKFAAFMATVSCLTCPKYSFAPFPGMSSCIPVAAGQIVATGGSASVIVPLGSKICDNMEEPNCDCVVNSKCVPFLACPVGTFGEDPPTKNCLNCKAGTTSFKSSISCSPCDKGRYNPNKGNKCSECPAGQFQDQSKEASLTCQICPTGFSQKKQGESSCIDLKWKKPTDCNDNEYLNNTSISNKEWKCLPCSEGGACRGSITIDNIPPLFGWWKASQLAFVECLYHPACLGEPNLALSNKYYENKTDLALYARVVKFKFANITNSSTSSCDISNGYRTSSRLCHTCATNYRRSSSDQCARCPTSSATNWGLMVLGLVMIMIGILFIAGTAIASAGKQTLSESVQKILLNYFQVAAMARIFPLQWPDELKSLFDFQGALSTVGDHLVKPDCVTSATAANLFYIKRAFFALLPVIVTLVSFVVWYIYGIIIGTPFFDKRQNTGPNTPAKSTPKDRFVITIGAVLYLMFPTLVAGTFKIFDCRTIGNDSYLHVDLEESCSSDRYKLMAGLLGVTQMILYVIGLPCLMLGFLIRNKDRLETNVVQCRYGLFYAGYKRERFYWETVLSLRKIGIVGLGVFGPGLGPVRQSLFALLMLLIFIVLEISGKPFKEPSPRYKILKRLELTSLIVLWLTMWCGIMIFSSTGDNNEGAVQVLTILVALMTSFMMIWLVGQLLRECLHEKRESGTVENIVRLRKKASASVMRRVSSWSRRSVVETSVTEIADEVVVVGDGGSSSSSGGRSGNGETVSEIELRTWSQPVNPAFVKVTEDELSSTSLSGNAFMAAAPPAPERSID